MHMENHQLTAQAVRHQDTSPHYSRRTNPYVVSPLVHVNSVSQTTSEDRSYVEVAIEQEIARSILLLATKMQHQSQNGDTHIRNDGDQEHLLEKFHKELESCCEGLHAKV